MIGVPSSNTGEVHIYQIDTTNSHWSKVGSNDITGTTVFDVFGASVDVSTINNEIVIAVGAYNISSSTHNNCGAVYIYKLNENNSWILVKSIFGESDNERIGNSLSFSNDGLTLAIGAPFYNNNKGFIRIYRSNGEISIWNKMSDDIIGNKNNDRFGYSLSLNNDGTILAIGAPYQSPISSDNKGYVKIYEFTQEGLWIPKGDTITSLSSGNNFGNSLSLNGLGNILVIGASYDNGNGNNSGCVKIYNWSESINNWTKMSSNIVGESSDEMAGTSVSVNNEGNILAVGSPHYSILDNDVRGKAQIYRLRLLRNVNVSKGWNLIGFSNDASVNDEADLIESGRVVWFDSNTGSYVSWIKGEPFVGNRGYWIKCKNDGNIIFDMNIDFSKEIEIQVFRGWNLIGLSKDGLLSSGADLINEDKIVWFNSDTGSYISLIKDNPFIGNRGYWVKCNNQGTLKFLI